MSPNDVGLKKADFIFEPFLKGKIKVLCFVEKDDFQMAAFLNPRVFVRNSIEKDDKFNLEGGIL